ncbi:helix-turn-helix domain-containing protein [Enterococcus rivorum]|uniref:Mga helix-turn-helix domain-containing protein n=1 Tax=Enterococcus rivorum TaxID=762845 RepID=A0A1E5KX99_9ENTE|nr:helix-turn-helix domain-containing protein [Enterococcus rivorum]MBP2099140.1 hypothetical protein [Enterococcus rivorum]OEH82289.1 hypothetical protein BCR26_13655 [Enterococcus rivorum]
MLENLLDKEDRRKLLFFQLLEESPQFAVRQTVIQDTLELSDFLFEKTYELLKEDLVEYSLEEYFQLDKDNITVSLAESGQASSDILLEIYLRKSLDLDIIKSIFLNQFRSVNDFAIDRYVAYTRVYRHLKLIKDFFREFDIKVSKKFVLDGKEEDIRFFYLSLFVMLYKGDYSLYKNNNVEKVQVFIDRLNKHSAKKLSEFTKMRLTHYLNIILVRSRQDGELKEEPKYETLDIFSHETEVWYLCSDFFSKYIKVSPEAMNQEILMLYSILLTEGFFKAGVAKRIAKIDEVRELNHFFVEKFGQVFSVDVRDTNHLTILSELSLLHYELSFFPKKQAYFSGKRDMLYFEESYPEYFEFCRDLVRFSKETGKLAIWENNVYAFYQYLFLLANSVPLDFILEPINICVDFSFGKVYNEFILKKIPFFSELAFTINDEISDATDLVLTDSTSLYDDKDVERIIWLSPPRPVDWSNFAAKVLEIRLHKHRE